MAMPSLTNGWKPQSTGEPVRTRIEEAMAQVVASEPESFDHDHDHASEEQWPEHEHANEQQCEHAKEEGQQQHERQR